MSTIISSATELPTADLEAKERDAARNLPGAATTGNTTAPPVHTIVMLSGGHRTTIRGKRPTDLYEEIERARTDLPFGHFLFLHHHDNGQDQPLNPNGVAIDPHHVVALVAVP